MQSYRTRQRLLNNEIYALKKEIAQLKANNSLEELLRIYLNSLEPKTEEVERGWTITDAKEQPTSPSIEKMADAYRKFAIVYKDFSFSIENEDMIEQYKLKSDFLIVLPYDFYWNLERDIMTTKHNERMYDKVNAFIEGYKANNHLEELEKWTDVQCYHNNSNGRHYIFKDELLKKINELKNQS